MYTYYNKIKTKKIISIIFLNVWFVNKNLKLFVWFVLSFIRLKFTEYTLKRTATTIGQFLWVSLFGLKMTRKPVNFKLFKHSQSIYFPKLNKYGQKRNERRQNKTRKIIEFLFFKVIHHHHFFIGLLSINIHPQKFSENFYIFFTW